MQAAVGVAQLTEAAGFIEARRAQFRPPARRACATWKSSSSCPKPRRIRDPSWFGFPIAVRPGSAVHAQPGDRVIWKSARSRPACCSPAICSRQPAYQDHATIASVGTLENTDFVMNNVFWIGVYPGLTAEPCSTTCSKPSMRCAPPSAARVGRATAKMPNLAGRRSGSRSGPDARCVGRTCAARTDLRDRRHRVLRMLAAGKFRLGL